jgi:hypothetical protein
MQCEWVVRGLPSMLRIRFGEPFAEVAQSADSRSEVTMTPLKCCAAGSSQAGKMTDWRHLDALRVTNAGEQRRHKWWRLPAHRS